MYFVFKKDLNNKNDKVQNLIFINFLSFFKNLHFLPLNSADHVAMPTEFFLKEIYIKFLSKIYLLPAGFESFKITFWKFYQFFLSNLTCSSFHFSKKTQNNCLI